MLGADYLIGIIGVGCASITQLPDHPVLHRRGGSKTLLTSRDRDKEHRNVQGQLAPRKNGWDSCTTTFHCEAVTPGPNSVTLAVRRGVALLDLSAGGPQQRSSTLDTRSEQSSLLEYMQASLCHGAFASVSEVSKRLEDCFEWCM